MPNFWKMQALGNDFVVWDTIHSSLLPEALDIVTLSHRHLGIGCDQMIFISQSKQADFACRFFNADGSEAEQCGNGLRCIAEYLHSTQQLPKKQFTLETKAGILEITYHSADKITVNMGQPEFEPAKIPCLMPTQYPIYDLKLSDSSIKAAILSMGNPHAIIQVNDLETFPVAKYGTEISQLAIFPNSVNVGFMKVLNKHLIQLRTHERGVGETYACGTNACAAVVAGIINQYLISPVEVKLFYGSLWIEWQGLGSAVMMTGPAVKVFAGYN